jgi:hypothetical protein
VRTPATSPNAVLPADERWHNYISHAGWRLRIPKPGTPLDRAATVALELPADVVSMQPEATLFYSADSWRTMTSAHGRIGLLKDATPAALFEIPPPENVELYIKVSNAMGEQIVARDYRIKFAEAGAP